MDDPVPLEPMADAHSAAHISAPSLSWPNAIATASRSPTSRSTFVARPSHRVVGRWSTTSTGGRSVRALQQFVDALECGPGYFWEVPEAPNFGREVDAYEAEAKSAVILVSF